LTTAAAKGYAPFEPQLGHSPITVWARAGVALDDVTIYLTPAVELTVVVQDQKGQPLASAEVRAFDERRGSAEARAVISDDKGEAHLSAQPFDVVEARRSGYRTARAFVELAAQQSGRLVVRMSAGTQPAPSSISGRVVDAKGQPVDGALVEADAQASFAKA